MKLRGMREWCYCPGFYFPDPTEKFTKEVEIYRLYGTANLSFFSLLHASIVLFENSHVKTS